MSEIIQGNFSQAHEAPAREKRTTVIRFQDAVAIHQIPTANTGHRVVEHWCIADYFINELGADTTDLYRFVHIGNDGRIENLSYGCVRGNGSVVMLDKTTVDEYGELLNGALALYGLCIPDQMKAGSYRHGAAFGVSDQISIIACECNNGIIVGGWLNSGGDKHISSQMLEYCMHAFKILNPDDETLNAKVRQVPLEARVHFRASMLRRKAIMRNAIHTHATRLA